MTNISNVTLSNRQSQEKRLSAVRGQDEGKKTDKVEACWDAVVYMVASCVEMVHIVTICTEP